MAAAFRSIVSALRHHLACRPRLARLVTVMAVLSTLLIAGAARADAQEVIEYYGTDALGSIRVVFAPDGTVKARSDYLPFGEEWQPTTSGGPLPTQRFTGQQRDAEESLDYFGSRSYQTRTGRLNSVDSVFAGMFEPQRWNRYTYALNNPLSYVDPDGRDPIKPDFQTGVTVQDPYQTYMNVMFLPWYLTGGNYTVDGMQGISPYLIQEFEWRPGNGEIFYQSNPWGNRDDNSSEGEAGNNGPVVTGTTTNPPPPACELPCTPPPPPGGPTIHTPGVVGWKTGQYELVFNRKGHNAASVGVGVGGVVGGAVLTNAAWTAPLRYDLIRFGVSKVPNQVVYGPGAWGISWVASIKGGGGNLPFHYHIHLYNWYKPWQWFQKTPILNGPLNR